MNWRRSLTRRLPSDLAWELRCRLARDDSLPTERTWPIPPQVLESARIRWPAEYDCPETPRFVQFLLGGFRRRLALEVQPIPQPHRRIVLFDFEVGGKAFRHAIDVHDLAPVSGEVAAACGVYFKYQFSEEGYRWPNVIPGAYVPKAPELYRFLSELRKLRDRNLGVFDVYGRFSPRMGAEIRARANELLAEQTAFRHEGTLSKVRYSRYLRDAARARICLDLPGQGPLCYRLVENLAIGSCVVGPAPRSRLPVPLEDGIHMAFCKPDLSDLVERCAYYLEHEEERMRLVRGSREYFDRYLHREQLTDYYLTRCLEYHRMATGQAAPSHSADWDPTPEARAARAGAGARPRTTTGDGRRDVR